LSYSNASTVNATFASANATYTFSTVNVSFAQAMQTLQTIQLQNSILADNGLLYPFSAILWIQPQ